MKKLVVLISIFSILASAPSIQSSDLNIPSSLSRQIINSLREKYIPMYIKYRGIESDRLVEIKMYDEKTNALLQTANVHLIRKDYFYKKPEIEVLEYTVNGKKEKTSKYKPVKSEPGYHVFDKNGDINYETKIVGYKTVAEYRCYEIKVTPKKATEMHYQGKLYYRTDNLELVHSSGTLGRISFPLKGLHIDLTIDSIDDLTVISSGVITASVDIPVIFPGRRIVTRFKALQNKPIL